MSDQSHDARSSSRPGTPAGGHSSPLGGSHRPDTAMSQSQTLAPSRGGTLKKKNSLKRGASLKRSSSRKSLAAGSVKSLALGDKEKYEGSNVYSAFYTPVPTKGQPTEVLASRFQDWRRVLKDLVTYFREVQKSHEARSKSLLALSNLTSNMPGPTSFLAQGGISDAIQILKEYHKKALTESNKAKQIEEDVIMQLTGLRGDLSAKIKEIKSLSGDFKNSVDKEMESTRKAVKGYQEALSLVETDPHATSGKGDPFIIRLGVERQIDRQIDEENYLHKAFLNLESSGRDLESIVVGEIQKAYNAYAGILKREADESFEAVENLRTGPVVIPKDHEWSSFVTENENFVDPALPIRQPELVHFPGKDAPAAAEVRAGMLERKSKYLKSYTPGWYVLSTTHLHEFKSPDRITSQAPIMSLYLQEQKLGSHSTPESSSHKFMLKGRQSGGMHRGHGWVFRAESHDTMLAWYEDIRNLTEKTGVDRENFVRKHARSFSGTSNRAPSVSSDGGMDEDEADRVPYSANPPPADSASTSPEQRQALQVPRSMPGGRFQSSDVSIERGLHRHSASSGSDDRDMIASVGKPSGAIPQVRESRPSTQDHARESSGPVFTMAEAQDYQRSVQTQAFVRAANAQHSPIGSPVEEPMYTIDTEANAVTPGPLTASRIAPLKDEDSFSAEQEGSRQHHEHVGPASADAPSAAISYPMPPEDNSRHDPTSARPQPTKIDFGPNPFYTDFSGPTTPATVATTATGMSGMSDSTADAPMWTTVRPPPISQNSVATISDLHVPGEFPKASRK